MQRNYRNDILKYQGSINLLEVESLAQTDREHRKKEIRVLMGEMDNGSINIL